MAELQDEYALKEKNFLITMEDNRHCEKKLEDQKKNLEISLDAANNELSDLRLKLSGAEGRVNALETQLSRLEGAKRDVEYKLSSVVSSLRRTIGFRQETANISNPLRSRSPSPRRSRPVSPTKGKFNLKCFQDSTMFLLIFFTSFILISE